jgi:hypothetical protein
MVVIILSIEIIFNDAFYKWYKSHLTTSILITVLAVIDIDILNTFFSQIAGIKSFDAPISKKLKYNILWSGIIGFIIGDVSKFVIQVCILYIYFLKIKKQKFFINLKNFFLGVILFNKYSFI